MPLQKKIPYPGDELLYIPFLWRDIIQKVEAQVGFTVLFDWGHYLEVQKRLEEKNSGMTDALREKYPLVWLVCDYAEERGKQIDLYATDRHQLLIVSLTQPNYTMQQRADKIFLPVLYPIYSALLTQIEKDVRIQVASRNLISHTKIDRYYWGGGSDKEGNNLFSDNVEAIEIKNLEINIKQPEC